jgi:lambda family phage portal protein
MITAGTNFAARSIQAQSARIGQLTKMPAPSPFSKRTIGDAIRAPRGNELRVIESINDRMKEMFNTHNSGQMRMYEAAVSTGMTADFPISVTDANAENRMSILGVMSRSQRLDRDDPYYHSAIKNYVVDVGGHNPFRLEMNLDNESENEMVEEAWQEAGEKENCCSTRDITRDEMYWQAIASMVRDGGLLFRHHRLYPKNPFGYAIEPIDRARLDHYWNRPQSGSENAVYMSRELDSWNAPVAYWILSRHPGAIDVQIMADKYRYRVPAEDIIELWDLRLRPGEWVGMPRMASVSNRLHRLDQFSICHTTAAIWSACKPFFFTQEIPTDLQFVPTFVSKAMEQVQNNTEGWQGADGLDGKLQEIAEPGYGRLLPYGWKIHQVDPKFPIEAAEGMMRHELRAVSAGSDVPYYKLSGDTTGINFSTIRAVDGNWHNVCKLDQSHIIGNLCHCHFRTWLPYAIASGRLKGISITRLEELRKAAKFFGRRWENVNPLQDRQAQILGIEAKLVAPSEIRADSEYGGDWEELMARIEADTKSAKKHGVDLTVDPATPTVQKGGVGDVAPEPQGEGLPAKTGGKQTITKCVCIECLTVREDEETICRECGGDGFTFKTYSRKNAA